MALTKKQRLIAEKLGYKQAKAETAKLRKHFAHKGEQDIGHACELIRDIARAQATEKMEEKRSGTKEEQVCDLKRDCC